MAFFQANTDGLVVDEMRNNGGLLCYGENIVSNLMPTNFRPLGYEIRATYEYLVKFGNALAGAQAGGNQTSIDQYQLLYDATLSSYSGNQPRTDAVHRKRGRPSRRSHRLHDSRQPHEFRTPLRASLRRRHRAADPERLLTVSRWLAIRFLRVKPSIAISRYPL